MVISTASQSSPAPHHKKRHGQHHKVSKHYVKAYWPYLPMLVVVLLGFVINLGLNSGRGVLSYATSMSISGLLQETNQQRANNGRTALGLNNTLSQAAQQKANDMVARDYWSHTSPEGTQPWQIISSVGYAYVTAGENLAYGFDSSSGALAGWMNSPGHQANVLSVNYQEVGFGIANSANYQGEGPQTVVVAMYASPKKAAPAPVAKAEPAKPATPTTPTTSPEPVTPAVPEPTPAEPAPATDQQSAAVSKPKAEDVAITPIQQLDQKQVARVDILTAGNAEWAVLALTALVTIGIIAFVYRHAKMWRKFLTRGEKFVIHHPVWDTVVVVVVVAGVILTQTVGVIR
jgi:hypothetical protein